jgi:hypothetical protein
MSVHPFGKPWYQSSHAGFSAPPRTVAKPSPLFAEEPFRFQFPKTVKVGIIRRRIKAVIEYRFDAPLLSD